MARDEFVEPRIGPKLCDVYSAQDASGVRENYSIHHLDNYIKYATLSPIGSVQKGRHRQDVHRQDVRSSGHDDCTSCHFCRQCTEDKKPRCQMCRKCFCGPCLANRFGQNASDMVQRGAWACPVCLDFCNCSGANCRRAQLGLEPTASLIHEAQAYGYSSVAEYLLVTALFREGSPAEAQRALEWLTHPNRRFSARAFVQSTATTGVRNVRQRDRPEPSGQSGAAASTDSLKRRRTKTSEERMSMQLQHLTGSLGFLSMQALQSQVQGLIPDMQLPPSASAPAWQASANRQPANSHPLAALQQAGRLDPNTARGDRYAAANAAASLRQPQPVGAVPAQHHLPVHHARAAPQPGGCVNSTPFPRQSTLVAQPSFQGAGMQTLPMMRSSPPQTGNNSSQPHGNSQQQLQQRTQPGLSMAGRCVGAPVSAEAAALWNCLERTEEAQQFQQRTHERSRIRRAPVALKATPIDAVERRVAGFQAPKPGGMRDAGAHETFVRHSMAAADPLQQNVGAPLGQAAANCSRPVGLQQQDTDVDMAPAPAVPSVNGGTHTLTAADAMDLPATWQQRIDAQSAAAPDQQEKAGACAAAGDCAGDASALPVDSTAQCSDAVNSMREQDAGPGLASTSAGTEQCAAAQLPTDYSEMPCMGANTDSEPECEPYILGAVHSDANCAILIDGLFKRTHELAVRGLTLQQRTRIADHMRAHQEAMAEHGHEYVPEEPETTSNEATWKRHGAELLVARSVMNNLQEAGAVAKRNEDFAAGAAVEGFGTALFERAEHVSMCNMLQDRVNTLLTVGHAAVLGACGQGARVHLVPDSAQDSQGKNQDSADGQLTHVQLNALLGVLKRHITSFWPCKRRSNLDARVVKRLTGQDKFVDFEGSDPAARGMLIRGLHDIHGSLQCRYKELLFASTATADITWNKWVMQEREMTWRALALTSRGLHSWGAVLFSQLHGLLVERTPGTSLMMLKAKGGALQKVNEEACTLLLGNLVMHVQNSLQQITVKLSALSPMPESVQPAVEALCSACSVLLSVFQVNSSEVSFWTGLMQPQSRGKGQLGTFLLSLTYSVLSQAYSILPHVLHLIPPAGTQTAKSLATCVKQLNQCVSAAEALLATWQGFCDVSDSEQLSRESQAAFAHSCLLLASAVSSLHRCGRCSLLQALAPFRIIIEDPCKSLPQCMSSLRDARAMGIKLVMSQLAKLTPNALLEISLPNTLSGVATPALWSMRWCLLAGSFCDVLLDHSTTSALFWPALVDAVSSQDCTEQLDIWGAERQLDTHTLQALQQDTTGVLWGQWLSCAMLSGMLPAELSKCPELATEVLLRRWAAPVPKAPGSYTLASASALIENQAECTLQSSLRVAVASVVALTAATPANLTNVPAGAQPGNTHKEHSQLLLTIWSACVLKSARLVISQARSRSQSTTQDYDAGNSGADAAQSQLRTEVRSSVLCGGHVEASCTSLQTLFQLLAGIAAPSELLCIPHSLLHPQLRAPDVPPVSIRSWQGQLLTALMTGLVYTLSYASQHLVALLGAENESGIADGARAKASQMLQWRRDAVASHVILQELAGAASGFADLSNVEALVNGNGTSMNMSTTRSDVFLPFLIGVQSAVSGAENGDASAVQAACNALAFGRCVVNSPKLRGGLGYALMLRIVLLPVLQSVAKAGKKESHAAVCLELASLVQASLPAAELLPPVANGSLHPGPHHSVPAHASLGWYALQQAILCSLQALTELLFLPPPIAAFVQQQVAAFQAPLAITAVEPGHCLWQVRKASVTLPAIAVEHTAGTGKASLLDGHHVKWATAALLLINRGDLEGLLWALLRNGRSGLEWVMHTLPRLGWLLVAAEACYCNGAVLMHGGPPLLSQRAALSEWLQKQIPWIRGKFEDLLETLHMLHNQDVSFLGTVQQIPESVLAEAKATSQHTTIHAPPPPPRAPPAHPAAAPQPVPVAPVMPPQPPPSLATTVPYSAVLTQHTTGSSANLHRAPKLAQPLPWAHRSQVLDEASLMHGGGTQDGPLPAGRVWYTADAGEVSSASAPGVSIAQDSCMMAQEGEGEVEFAGETQMLSDSPHADAANIATQPLTATQPLAATQPYSAAATQPHSAAAAKENSQILAQVRREGAALLREAIDQKNGSRYHDEDEVDSTGHL